MKLKDLRPGAVFVTESGTIAMKTEYHTFDDGTQADCYLLESGESAHFPLKDDEPVSEIPLTLICNAIEIFKNLIDLLDSVKGLELDSQPCEVQGCNEPAIYEGWHRATDPFMGTPTGLIQRRCVCVAHKDLLIGGEYENI